MPARYLGSKEDRLEALERRGKRCDGSHRFCVQAATSEYTVLKADPATGKGLPGEEPFILKGCSKHKRRFGNSTFYEVLSERVIGGPND